jgi:hypothetical protein
MPARIKLRHDYLSGRLPVARTKAERWLMRYQFWFPGDDLVLCGFFVILLSPFALEDYFYERESQWVFWGGYILLLAGMSWLHGLLKKTWNRQACQQQETA